MPRVNNFHHLQLAWNRAKVLADKANISPAIARAYLATIPQERRTILDNIRPKGPLPKPIKELIQELQHYTPRPSKGDNTQPPRAGAPEKPRQYRRKTRGTTNYDTLRTLKTLADENGGIENLQTALDTLREITK